MARTGPAGVLRAFRPDQRHRALEHRDRAGVGVEFDLDAQGQRELAVDVANHRARVRGDAERLDVVVQDVGNRQRAESFARAAAVARPPDDAFRLAENAGQLELREHAVEAVRGLLDVFEEQDAVLEIRQEARPDDGREDREVAAEQPPRALPGVMTRVRFLTGTRVSLASFALAKAAASAFHSTRFIQSTLKAFQVDAPTGP